MECADRLTERGWDVVGTCWILRGAVNGVGYAYLGVGGRRLTAPRAAWEAWHGPIPTDCYIGNTCTNKGRCVSPQHLTVRTINRRVCTRRGCADPPHARDLCHRHFEAERAHRASQASGATCLVPDCTYKQADDRGLCQTHLVRAGRSGYLDLLPNVLSTLVKS